MNEETDRRLLKHMLSSLQEEPLPHQFQEQALARFKQLGLAKPSHWRTNVLSLCWKRRADWLLGATVLLLLAMTLQNHFAAQRRMQELITPNMISELSLSVL